MKFKDISSQEYLEVIKNNPNIELEAKEIRKVEPLDIKKDNAVLALYNIINYYYPYNILEDGKDEKEILKDIINNIEKEIGREESINSKEEINDLISFENANYLVIDVINYNNSKYLYIINNGYYDNDVAIVKKIDDKFECINDNEEFKHVVYELIQNFKDKILELI
ncbi:MAG: hypothetical protein IJK67_04985 [Bacilli bacterium]|nr:hypothetical protein [Bacilli bacterium]